MKTNKLSVLAVMAVLALWVSGCGTGMQEIVVPDDGTGISDGTNDPGDTDGDEPIEPEDDGPDHATPTPHEGWDGSYHAQSDKPQVKKKPDLEIVAEIPAAPHDDEPYDLSPEGTLQPANPIELCEECFQEVEE
jgi:hypothetical protein